VDWFSLLWDWLTLVVVLRVGWFVLWEIIQISSSSLSVLRWVRGCSDGFATFLGEHMSLRNLSALVYFSVVSFTFMAAAQANESHHAAVAASEAHDAKASEEKTSAAKPSETKAPVAKAAVETPSVAPEVSLQWLKNGNTRFTNHNLRSDGQSSEDLKRLSTGQHPHAIVLSCSDSRVPPEIVFDQKLGELFVVRTAGESLDDNVIGSIEYAVQHLGSRLIVVMGHTSCGAVNAALGSLDGSSVGTPALDHLVGDMHPRLAEFKGHAKSGADVHVESFTNAKAVAADLATRSKLLREGLESGKISIVPSLYDLSSGRVVFESLQKQTEVRLPASTVHEDENHAPIHSSGH
jgi:carbonic anhydrase